MSESVAPGSRPESRLRVGDNAFCPHYRHAIQILERRWTGAVIRGLLAGESRFNDLAASYPGMSKAILSQRLKELEYEGLVSRIVHDETPVRIEYQLTDKGQALAGPVNALTEWAEQWLPGTPHEDGL